MAERRMFAKTIIDSDAFLDMPLTAQALYFHLSMRADDDGFVNNPKKIQRMIGCNDDDMKLLIVKLFVIPFESGVCVIKHWKVHNYIQKDRYKETSCIDERKCLSVQENGVYSIMDTECIQDVSNTDTQVRLGKDSLELGKDKKDIVTGGQCPPTTTTKKFIKPTVSEVAAYCRERNNNIDAEQFVSYYQANGWRVGRNPMKDWRAAVHTWEKNERGRNPTNGNNYGKSGKDARTVVPQYGTVL